MPNLRGTKQKPSLAQDTSTTTSIRVRGMDYAACAFKIENALPQVAGVAQVNVSFAVGMADGKSGHVNFKKCRRQWWRDLRMSVEGLVT